MRTTAQCHGCGAPILWRLTPAERSMPLDAQPVDAYAAGAYVITNDITCRPGEPMFDAPGTVYHMNHWSACPLADQFKGKGNRQ